MSKKLINSISLFLSVLMLLGMFASCDFLTSGNEQEESTPGTSITPSTEGNKDNETSDKSKETNKSETGAPETNAPETGAPETGAPETNAPETNAPETNAPETNAPETNAPETNAPETNAPETNAPETNKPEDTDKPKDYTSLEVQNDALIQMSNGLTNQVQAFFTDGGRTHFTFKNLEMMLTYARTNASPQLVESIKNTHGVPYINNTMDVFVRMNGGSTYYASGSTKSAEANLYRFGYYYYQGLFEFQNFAAESYDIKNPTTVDIRTQQSYLQQMTRRFERNESGNILYIYEITDSADPGFGYANKFNYSTSENNALVIVAKALGATTGAQLFVDIGNGFKGELSKTILFVNDGKFHTYYIPLDDISGYNTAEALKGIRFDPNGGIGGGIAIESITIGNVTDVPYNLSINRHFHVYSNKMHHAIQFAVTDRTENIAEIGMRTEIPTANVSKLIVVTKDSKTYTSLDAGFSWDDVVAVGFDITAAGVFGFILPDDPAAGNITVTVEDGKYIIEQTRVPFLADGTAGVIIPSIDTTKKDENGNYVHAEGVKNNGNDVYLAQRVYTDENHDFTEFLKETGFERHPLIERRVNIDNSNSNNASFGGYDPIRGIYILNIGTPMGGFYTPFNDPQKNYKVNFTLRSDVDRDIYIMTAGKGGLLECATLMDRDMMLLPVPIEVIKNFSEATGERNLYNISDPTFSEAIFPLSLKQNINYTYTLINLYQSWGNFPLKQLSSIPFHCPYYHLSTGVTETNCILPWLGMVRVSKTNSSTLPDFRSMSAPFWKGQPQHNSSGAHTWIHYTDSEGGTYIAECVENIITSYGPTYAELVWHNITDDGKIKVTYTHMEMPQTDENRSYYTMEYEFLDDLTINNFKDNFEFYKVGDNNGTGTYKKIGYLDEHNNCQVIDSNQDATAIPEKVLGDNCPYFSFFMMPDWNRESDSAEGYANVAFLVYNSEFIIGGEEKDYNFLIKNPKDYVAITLNEAGTIEFKAGDKITINAILLPWGSQELEDDPANRLNQYHATGYTEFTYSTKLEDGTLYMDKNVRDVRENTLLNPLTVTSTTDDILTSPFLPKVKSRDGKSAIFTLSGGANNTTVRIYGFEKLTNPKVERQLENGEWEEFVISSKNNPVNGYYHYYDGYMVNYDEDGTYSYSFVTDMADGKPQTFRITASEDFQGWPTEPVPQEKPNLLNIYTDYEELSTIIMATTHVFGSPSVDEDELHGPFVRVFGRPGTAEAYCTLHMDDNNKENSGKYLVIKYRVPTTNKESVGSFQLWASTETHSAGDGTGSFYYNPIEDGEWHVVVFDLTKTTLKSYTPNDNGEYLAQLLRFDIFNKELEDPSTCIDFAYIGIDSELTKICALEDGKFETIDYYDGNKKEELDVATATIKIKTYLDPTSGYTESDLKFGSILDSVNGVAVNISANSQKSDICIKSGVAISKKYTINLAGWCCVEGGVEKYVYSIDGGKTWIDIKASPSPASDKMLEVGGKNAGGEGYTFPDPEATRKNGNFQDGSGGLTIDLTGVTGIVDVIIAAVPAKDTQTLVLLYCFEKVDCSFESIFHEDSAYKEILLPFGSQIDSVNGVDKITIAGSALSEARINSISTYKYNAEGFNLNYAVRLKGWSAVDGGISKYVWTADGGKTWNDCVGHWYGPEDPTAILESAQKKSHAPFGDANASKKNCAFQGTGLLIDLSAYKDSSEPLDIYVCAVPAGMNDRVVVLYRLNDVVITPVDETDTPETNTPETDTPETDTPEESPYIDASSGYTKADIPFASALDFVSGVYVNKGRDSLHDYVPVLSGCVVSRIHRMQLKGWCCADGGIEKYVYSVDGGRTWIQLLGTPVTPNDTVYAAAQKRAGGDGFQFADQVNSRDNGQFGECLEIDLSIYEGTIDIIFAAVPKADKSTLIVLYVFDDVNCSYISSLDENSAYKEAIVSFGSQIDSVNGVALKQNNVSGSRLSVTSIPSLSTTSIHEQYVNSDYVVRLKGWSAVEGGVSKYIWTADNGQTWNDCTGYWSNGSSAMVTTGSSRSHLPLNDTDETKKNCAWQAHGIGIDLTDYKDSTEPLDIYVCAVLEGTTDKIVILYHLDDVTITK